MLKRFAELVAAWLAVVASCAVPLGIGCRDTSGYYLAHYTDKSFSGSYDRYYDVRTGLRNRHYKVATIYLKLNDGSVIKLSELPEETVRGWVMQKSEVLREQSVAQYEDIDGFAVTNYDVDGASRILFHDGKLVGCGINGMMSRGPWAGVQIGPTADGEFLPFPISREDLVRVFGQPDTIAKGPLPQH